MSPTPRTDAETADPIHYYDMGGHGIGQMKNSPDGDWVPADFARTLERECAELRKDKERLDWLESHREFHVTFSQGGQPSWGILHHKIAEAGTWYSSNDLRTSLDHKMEEVAAGYPHIHPSGKAKLIAAGVLPKEKP